MFPQVPIPSLPFIGLYAITVRSLAVLRESLQHGGVPFAARDRYVFARFPSALGTGGWIFAKTPDHLPWR